MLTKELIGLLQKMPQEQRVVMHGCVCNQPLEIHKIRNEFGEVVLDMEEEDFDCPLWEVE